MAFSIKGGLAKAAIKITDEARDAVRLAFNPSGLEDVNRLKTLSAAFISECERITAANPKAAREMAVAKTDMQTASMWAVLGATKGL